MNFRNLKDKNILFSPKFNLFIGKNGQGKTSVLEAIYFSATGKSFRTSKNVELIKHSKDKAGSYIVYEDMVSDKTLSVKVDKTRKEYKFNGKKVGFDEFYGKLNVITFIPEDIELIVGAPSFRRSFFDAEISQTNYSYFQELKEYTKVLKIRNKFLKERDIKNEMYKIYEKRFVELSASIILKRLEYVRNISIILNLNYRKLFDEKKELELKYDCFVECSKGIKKKQLEEIIRTKIERIKLQELKYGYSLIGPQRDDFKFYLNSKEAKSFSSQGEKKSIVFSLKLSEIDMVLKERREPPIFIIDDISSYFDSIRKESIMRYLKKREIQIFISSTSDIEVETKNFYVEKGEIVDGTI